MIITYSRLDYVTTDVVSRSRLHFYTNYLLHEIMACKRSTTATNSSVFSGSSSDRLASRISSMSSSSSRRQDTSVHGGLHSEVRFEGGKNCDPGTKRTYTIRYEMLF